MSHTVIYEHFLPEMSFSGSGCDEEDWDPNVSFKDYIKTTIENGTTWEEEIRKIGAGVTFLKKDEVEVSSTDPFDDNEFRQMWSLSIDIETPELKNVILAENKMFYPFYLVLDWMQETLPRSRYGLVWGMTALIHSEQDEPALRSCIVLNDGTLQECVMGAETPPFEQDDFHANSPDKLSVFFIKKGDLKKEWQHENAEKIESPSQSASNSSEAKAKDEARATAEEQTTIVDVADPIVEESIRQDLEKPTGELTEADLEKVTIQILSFSELTDVKGLEKLTQLEYLELQYNKLTDVKGLEKLTQLTRLDLTSNKLTDVKGLEKLTQLMNLSLSKNQITDVSALKELTQLTNLSLSKNQITDVSALANLTQLTYLGLGGNQLTDVKGLEKLTQLEILDLDDNKLTDVKGLENLTKLEGLELGGNPDLGRGQIDQLKKALPKCRIESTATK